MARRDDAPAVESENPLAKRRKPGPARQDYEPRLAAAAAAVARRGWRRVKGNEYRLLGRTGVGGLILNAPLLSTLQPQSITPMNILLLGSGGANRPLAWKISQSPVVENFILPWATAAPALTVQMWPYRR